MGGRIVYKPHVHSRPPILAVLLGISEGSVWQCDCGKASWTRWRAESGELIWREGRGPFPDPITDDLEGAIRYIRRQANIHRLALGLPTIPEEPGSV